MYRKESARGLGRGANFLVTTRSAVSINLIALEAELGAIFAYSTRVINPSLSLFLIYSATRRRCSIDLGPYSLDLSLGHSPILQGPIARVSSFEVYFSLSSCVPLTSSEWKELTYLFNFPHL